MNCAIYGKWSNNKNELQRHFSVKNKNDQFHKNFKALQIELAEGLFLSDRKNNIDEVLRLNPQLIFTPKTLHSVWKDKYGSNELNKRRVEIGNKVRTAQIYAPRKLEREKDLDKRCPVCEYRYKNVNSISHHVSMTKDTTHIEFMDSQKLIAKDIFNEQFNTFKILELHPEFKLSERVLIRFWYEIYGKDEVMKRRYTTSSTSHLGIKPWHAGLNQTTDFRMAKYAENKRNKYKDGIPYLNNPENAQKLKLAYKEGRRKPNVFSEESKNNISQKLIEGHVSGRIKLSHGKHGHLPAELGYEAHNTRSTWETNIALIFRKLKIVYKYEPKVFPLYDKTGNLIDSYTPDFYITAKDKWYEIKGVFKSAKDWSGVHKNFQGNITKLNLFKEQYPEEYAKLRIIGKKEYAALTKRFKSRIPNWESGRK
jgi:hypothetical protein